ncbi:hypothetical protein L1987_52057 [Smallanthus sonchifolius]|uniref:Uncharacterized protein n=1 Tax=Smallanthus sonchifolius TaxID=185202 RepID=A0ACB9ET66_9ASTR|nr:hypothetical protein L1987_52057 [Smallanthus sonchifolius]
MEEKSNFKQALGGRVEAHLKEASDNTWPAIKTLFYRQTIAVVNSFSSALSSFKMDEQEKGDMISKLKDYGRGVVEGKAREATGKVKYLMKDRFEFIFCYDDDSMPRDWTENHDIQAMAKAALSSSLKLLSVLAAIRLDGESDRIWNTLKQGTTTSPHLLASSAWEEDPEMKKTLITPVQCKSFWDQFKQETEKIITQAISIQYIVAYGFQKGNMKKKKIRKHVVTTSKVVAGTACVVGIVSTVAAATATGNVAVAVGVAAAGGAAVGVVVAGALVVVAAHTALASLKNMARGV